MSTKIRDLDDTTKLVLFRAGMLIRQGVTPEGVERLKKAHEDWEAAHAKEIYENILRALNSGGFDFVLNDDEEWCGGCDGTGFMKGTMRSCPKCKGSGGVRKSVADSE